MRETESDRSRRLTTSRAAATALAGMFALAAAGCGGGDSSSGSTDTADQPKPKQPLSAQLAPFNHAISIRSCKAYEPLVSSIVRTRPPGAPATAVECRRPNPGWNVLHRYSYLRAQQYGTGGLMEAKATPSKTSDTVWVLDGDGQYRFTEAAGIAAPQIGSRFTRGVEASRVADDLIAGIRAGDCSEIEPLLAASNRLVLGGGSRRAACQSLLKGRFFAPAVRKTPKIDPVALGGTGAFAFVGIPTRDAYYTMPLTLGPGKKLAILDILPSTPVQFPKS